MGLFALNVSKPPFFINKLMKHTIVFRHQQYLSRWWSRIHAWLVGTPDCNRRQCWGKCDNGEISLLMLRSKHLHHAQKKWPFRQIWFSPKTIMLDQGWWGIDVIWVSTFEASMTMHTDLITWFWRSKSINVRNRLLQWYWRIFGCWVCSFEYMSKYFIKIAREHISRIGMLD